MMFDLFSDIFTYRDNALAKIDPRAKLAIALAALQTFLTGTTPIFAFTLAGWEFTAKAEGLRQGMLLGARVLGAVSVVFLLSVVTPAHRIFQALRWFRLSRNWLET